MILEESVWAENFWRMAWIVKKMTKYQIIFRAKSVHIDKTRFPALK